MENKLKVGIAHGDVNGIGYEIIIKMMAENKVCEVCVPILYGSSKVAAYHRKTLNIENFSLNSILHARDANAKRCNIVNCVDDAVKVDLGMETPESDGAAMLALKHGLDELDKKELDVLVGAPQGATSFRTEGTAGSVEYLAKRYNVQHVLPLFIGEKMKISFVTTDIALKDVPANITRNNIFNKLKTLDSCLRKDFVIRKPRIAVLGFNPHAGEQGLYGEEEKDIIVPAIENARNNGIMALGPYAADSFFSGIEFEKFDAVLAMYYDQGMVPFKAIEGNSGALLIAGLPIVFTSTVHGMAYDIVGKGIADELALRNAMYVGIDVFNNRTMDIELSRNPLKHYDIGGNSNESDLNVEQIAGMKQDTED